MTPAVYIGYLASVKIIAKLSHSLTLPKSSLDLVSFSLSVTVLYCGKEELDIEESQESLLMLLSPTGNFE